MPLRVVICWPDISGYMAACWRSLAARPDIELSIIALREPQPNQTAFSDDLMRGLSCVRVDPDQQSKPNFVADLVAGYRPQVVFVPGWFIPCFRQLPWTPALRDARFGMYMDTQLKGTWKQSLGRPIVRRFVRRLSFTLVPSERSWQYARRLGIPESRIMRGGCGYDWNLFAPVLPRRLAREGGWPQRFLYFGRYAPEKGLDVLLEAYAHYRSNVADPWPLICCGKGPLAPLLAGRAGVEDRGFVQPAEQPAMMEQCGAFVLASRYEPWGVAIGEAAASGLPILCSDACGAVVELVRPYFNGLTAATNDITSTAAALRWLHDNHSRLPEMGQRSREISHAFGADAWAERFAAVVGPLI